MTAFRIRDEEAGERLDKIVARKLPELGRRAVSRLFGEKRVLVDGRVAKKGGRAASGSDVTVLFEGHEIVEPEPDLPLSVVYEAPDVVVVTKPAGQPTAPIRIGETGTLANAILGRYPETRGIGHRPREPGLVHRLDTQTSGLVIVARNAPSFARLRSALSAGKFEKRYLAVVASPGPDAGIVEEWLAPDPSNPRRVRAVPREARGARPATTRFRSIRAASTFRLLEIEVSHAYRHQVRAHLAWMGLPIVGDALYGGVAVPMLGARHALHASYVAWAGDEVVPGFAASDPLPAELDALFSL